MDLTKLDLDKLTEEEKRELDQLLWDQGVADLAADLYKFFLEAWKVLEPNTPLVDSWHYKYICEWLTLVHTGEFKKRYPQADGLVINVPPQSGKSSLITMIFPVWCWLNDPTRRLICASYSLDLAVSHSVKRRALIEDKHWFQPRWGTQFKLREDQNAKGEFYNNKTGQMIAASVGSNITGKHGNILVLDDPLNPKGAASNAERKEANTWFDETFLSRRILPDGVIVVVMQRLHEEDVTGKLLAENTDPNKPNWIHIKIPLVCEEDTRIEFPISRKVFTRKKGNVLQSARNTLHVVANLQRKPKLFAGQFQQRPAPAEGNIVKRSWIKFYGDPSDPNSPTLPTEFQRQIQSWDLSFKGNNDSDYVCGLTAGVNGADRYLLDRTSRQMTFTQAVTAITEKQKEFPLAKEILIEDKANGPAVIDSLKSKIAGIIAINPRGDKKERLEIASYAVESGNWYFPHPSICPWIEEFIENLVAFPNAKYDDDVDAFSQLENRIGKRGGPAAMLEAYGKLLKGEQADPDPEPKELQPGEQTHIPQIARTVLAGDVVPKSA